MNRILFVILAALLILSTFVTGCGGPCVIGLAPIHCIDMWADESLPPQYFLDVVSGEPSGCDHFDSYNMTRAGNTTITVEIFNLSCSGGCPAIYSYVEHTIPLGSDFVPGGNYMVEVNDVTVTFIAGVMTYLAPICDIYIYISNLGSSYYLLVWSVEPCICDHFVSYNVTRAGNTIQVGIFNRRCGAYRLEGWYCSESPYGEHSIPLGSDFVPGVNYTVEVNGVTETFIAQ